MCTKTKTPDICTILEEMMQMQRWWRKKTLFVEKLQQVCINFNELPRGRERKSEEVTWVWQVLQHSKSLSNHQQTQRYSWHKVTCRQEKRQVGDAPSVFKLVQSAQSNSPQNTPISFLRWIQKVTNQKERLTLAVNGDCPWVLTN